MRPIYLTASTTDGGLTAAAILDQYLDPTDVALAVELHGNTGGGASYSVQYSMDDPYGTYTTDYNTNAVWFNHPSLVTLSTDGVSSMNIPARAVRLVTTTHGTGGTATPTLTVVQAGAST